MNKYDVIVIGAGNGGLVAALELAKSNKKVLVLESHSVPGGMATSFIRGRFEFEASLHELCEYGSKDNQGKIYELFTDLGIVDKIEFVTVPDAYHVYATSTHEEYKMPFGIDNYIEKLESYVPGSKPKVSQLFELLAEVDAALKYLESNKDNIDANYLLEHYANFMKVAPYSVEHVFEALSIPKKAQEILATYWVYLGSQTSKLSFVHYGSMLYSYIKYGAQIPKKRSHDISLVLTNEIEKCGGVIKYFSPVKQIIIENDKIRGVRTQDDKEYYAPRIIGDISPNVVYGKLLPKEIVPKKALKLTNSRVLGARGFSIYLGLNQDADSIGLKDYSYFIYNSLNSDKEYEYMSSINDSTVAVVLNRAFPAASLAGTCIMHFTTLFMGDVFDKVLTLENYFDLKNQIAKKIIANFEKTTGIDITPYIEEIEIASPVTYARYTKHPDGVIYGYKGTGLDNLLPRIMNMENENFIPNLYLCGGFGVRLSGYSSTYMSGKIAASLALRDMKGDED